MNIENTKRYHEFLYLTDDPDTIIPFDSALLISVESYLSFSVYSYMCNTIESGLSFSSRLSKRVSNEMTRWKNKKVHLNKDAHHFQIIPHNRIQIFLFYLLFILIHIHFETYYALSKRFEHLSFSCFTIKIQ